MDKSHFTCLFWGSSSWQCWVSKLDLTMKPSKKQIQAKNEVYDESMVRLVISKPGISQDRCYYKKTQTLAGAFCRKKYNQALTGSIFGSKICRQR